jgi:ferredoxin
MNLGTNSRSIRGNCVALFNAILHLMIKNDWIDHSFIENHTVGFDDVAAGVEERTPARTAQITGIAEKGIRQAAERWGRAKTSFLMHARGIEHSSHGVQNVLGAINIALASGRIGRENCGYATITGQGNGQGGREHGQKCDQLPGMRDIGNPEHRAHVASVWGVDPTEPPEAGVDAYEIFRKIDRGEICGLLSISFNPIVSLPDNNFVRRALEKLGFYVAIDSHGFNFHSPREPRCIACNNCVLACPFGIPKMNTRMELMMKCDQCYDRTSTGKLPMCASVCPSQALFFGTEEEIARLRPNSAPINTFRFGAQTVTTRTRMLVPKNNVPEQLDVLSAMYQPTIGNVIEEDLLLDGMNSEDDAYA